MGEFLTSAFNDVLPPRVRPPLPDRDARDYALMRLRDFLAALVYRRTGNPTQQTIPFRVPKQDIHIYQPDNVWNAKMPGFAIVPGRGTHEPYGLGPPEPIDGTWGVYGPGTALVRLSDYTEVFTLECWGSKHAERRALVAGVKVALRQNDGGYAVRLSLPDYYGQTAEFSLDESAYIDGDEVVLNRRRAQLFVKLTVQEVSLANFSEFKPQLIRGDGRVGVTVLDASDPTPLHCGVRVRPDVPE